MMALAGKPFQAFPGQDHKAHIDAHLSFMSISMVQNNPAAMMALQKNILEHISCTLEFIHVFMGMRVPYLTVLCSKLQSSDTTQTV